jgi:hypothetical protein
MVPVFCLLLFLQDDLVQQLGDDSAQVREQAERRLSQMGASAKAPLKRAAESDDVEVRTRARRILDRIEARERLTANGLDVLADPPNLEAQVMDVPLSRAFDGASAEFKPAKEFPDDGRGIWRFLDRKKFQDAAAFEAKPQSWLLRSQGTTILANFTVDGKRLGLPRFYILVPPARLKLTPESLKWDAKNHFVPCLKEIAVGEGWSSLFLSQQKENLFIFHWKQSKPYPNLRVLYITESFVLFAIAYQ